MKIRKRFSKDPKIRLMTLEDFLRYHGYLVSVSKKDLWKSSTVPEMFKTYYKFTSDYLVSIYFGVMSINYGTEEKEKLESIDVAYRDGKTEYELFDKKINELKEVSEKRRKKKDVYELITALEKAKKLIPRRRLKREKEIKQFESYLSFTGYKTKIDDLKNHYLVFDVETNGLRKANDDLLSLSIYDPTSGMCYNRYFPLDLQPVILTGYIHGITDEDLSNATHMTQDEMDMLIDYFHLKDRVLLSYSGGKGTFDSGFIQNYCKRRGIHGFENLQFENIKNKIPEAPYGSEGQLTKDNLCRIFGIEGVSEVHSSYNDCILEWKLFEKLETECVFFIDNHLYKYTPEYIIPVSYLIRYPELASCANVTIPNIIGNATELLKLEFPKKLIKDIKKFPTNITGITIEHGINVSLQVKKQDNYLFLAENRSHLKYVGSVDNRINEIPFIANDDGTIKAINIEDKNYIDEVNLVTNKIIEQLKPITEYLKETVFIGDRILSQELSISDDKKVLALCDLSDSESVVEIKTYRILEEDRNVINSDLAKQLYYQANGRNIYVVSIVFERHRNMRTYEWIVDGLNIYLYKIDLIECP